jgi:hypothetical protein
MIVLVTGASDRAMGQLRTIAPSGVDIVNEPVAEADWMIVSTTVQRVEAVRARGLAAFRVLECPEIAAEIDPSAADTLRRALVKMAAIGGPRPFLSSIGLAIVWPFVRRAATRTRPDPAARPSDDPEMLAQSGVPPPMPAGARLDDLLAASDRNRAKRALAQVVRTPGGRS